MAADDYAVGVAQCADAGALADDCKLTLIERFDHYQDCDLLLKPGECHFRYAELTAREGKDVFAGLKECRKAEPFGGECDEHLLGMLAMMGATLPEAEANFAHAKADLVMTDPRPHYLRLWFRHQYDLGRTPSDAQCSDAICRKAARHEAQSAAHRSPDRDRPIDPAGAPR